MLYMIMVNFLSLSCKITSDEKQLRNKLGNHYALVNANLNC
jgi:hypothetical protein